MKARMRNQKTQEKPNGVYLKAKKLQAKRLADLEKRGRLKPCIDAYNQILSEIKESDPDYLINGLSYLTTILRGTYQEVLGQIATSGKTGIAATNAVKRSAGTNFQGLVEYAILRWLESTQLPVAIGTNAPKSMKKELTIKGVDADGGDFAVEPDIDISLWIPNDDPKAPVIFLSAKTSLVDRAGQAARWKLYLDLHQTTCTHTKDVTDCPIHRTRIEVGTLHPITHCIVTANIYKIDTTQPGGELTSGQCRNNTYMFKHKYTTRNDNREIRPNSWESLSNFPELVNLIFSSYLSSQQMKTFVRLEPIETS